MATIRRTAVVLGVLLCSAIGCWGDNAVRGRVCHLLADPSRLAFVEASQQLPAECLEAAQGTYLDMTYTASSFGKLRIVANNTAVDPLLRYRAAGYLEGWLTAKRIWQHFNNMKNYFEQQLYPGVDLWGAPMQWLQDQESWLRDMIQSAHEREGRSTHSSTTATGASILHPQQYKTGSASGSSTEGTFFHQGARGAQDVDPALSGLGAVELVLAQFDGLVEGYAARVKEEEKQGRGGPGAEFQPMLREHHMFMQNNGELYDIVDGWLAGAWGDYQPEDVQASTASPASAADTTGSQRVRSGAGAGSGTGRAAKQAAAAATAARQMWRDRWRSPRPADVWLADVSVAERCSALIKVTGDLSDILIGHATWDTFTNMLRIYKHYELGSPGYGRLSFSSYPGETFSDDDFYLSESGLIVLETTNHVFNPDLYRALSPHTLLSWQRVRAAMLVAGSGQAWVQVFSWLNSGTYCNQYMVLDLNRFQPKLELMPGLLWVVEQLPGLVVAQDVTDQLARGYWGSYNVPFFQQVYNLSGYPEVLSAMTRDQQAQQDKEDKEHFDVPVSWLRYQTSPRAAIFRRDQGAADTLDRFKDLVRYNDYQHDPYAHGAPQAAVCGRGDLPHLRHMRDPSHGPGVTGAAAFTTAASRKLQAGAAAGGRGGLGSAQQASVGARRQPVLPKGCYDGKVTSAKLARQLISEVVNGPTTSHGLPVFSWGSWDDSYSHMGHPTSFNFTWERMAADDLLLQ